VPTIELRASVILGSGSLSFELVRALVERLPVMLIPRWVSTRTQPIAIGDVIAYLAAAAEVSVNGSMIVEIGGSDRVSYSRPDARVRSTARPAIASSSKSRCSRHGCRAAGWDS
jgi:uncharacterized protein YbjT (DUF2867 family)